MKPQMTQMAQMDNSLRTEDSGIVKNIYRKGAEII